MKTLITTSMLMFCMVVFGQDSKNDYRQQLSDINKQISQQPGDISLYLEKANLYNYMNDFANAGKNYNKVIKMYEGQPDDRYKEAFAEACFHLADDHFFRISADEAALRYVRSGLEIAPDYKPLEILEPVILADMDGKEAMAGEKFEAVSQKYPEDTRLLAYYAGFLKKSEPMKAAQQYEKIIALEPSNEKIMFALAVIYNNEASRMAETTSDPGQVYDLASQAVGYFEKVYQLNPEDQELATIVRQLKAEIDNKPEEGQPVEIQKVPF